MRRTASRLFALSSALLLVVTAQGRTRPRYGDSVRAEMQASVSDYEPTPDVLMGLVYETLVAVREGRLRPGLASSWATPNDGAHWEFTLRPGVTLHDGNPLTSTMVVQALSKAAIQGCRIRYSDTLIIYDCAPARPNLPSQLTDSKYVIASVGGDGVAIGTGPYRVEKREHARIALRANDDYWGGRTYLDALELIPGRDPRDQMSDLALDRADIIEVSSEQWRRAQQDRLRLDISQPALTMYLVINSSKPELRDIRLRQAISWSIDRAAIHNVIYQRQGEIAGGLLPNWLTGYAFLFSSGPDLARAKQLVAEFGRVPQLTIGYDADDPQQRLIAERIALNVREAGIGMQAVASSGAGADIRLREIAINTSDAVAALDEVLTTLDLAPAAKSAALDALYGNERAALQTYMAIPLVHLPKVTALKDRIHNWTSSPAGEWELGGIWVTPRSINREGRP